MRDTRWDCTCGSFGIGDAEYTRHAISTKGPHTKYPAAPAAAEPLGTCGRPAGDKPHAPTSMCVNWKPIADEPLAAPAAAEPRGMCETMHESHNPNHEQNTGCVNWKPLAEPVPQSEECTHPFLMRHYFHGEIWWQCQDGCDFIFREDSSRKAAEIITNCCGLLDTIKQEWGEAWSAWDQSVRDSASAWLKEFHGPLAAPSPAETSQTSLRAAGEGLKDALMGFAYWASHDSDCPADQDFNEKCLCGLKGVKETAKTAVDTWRAGPAETSQASAGEARLDERKACWEDFIQVIRNSIKDCPESFELRALHEAVFAMGWRDLGTGDGKPMHQRPGSAVNERALATPATQEPRK